MYNFNTHTVDHILHKGRNSIIFRALEHGSNRPVIIKALNHSHPTPTRLARFQYEYDLTRKLRPEHTSAYGQENGLHFFVMEDTGATSLDRLNLAGRMETGAFLELAIGIVKALKWAHAKGILHKDINPTNIIHHSESGQTELIDFGISSMLTSEEVPFQDARILNGTLAYIAPEQTGRVNRSISRCSDLYSLGITLFELLTGQLPFSGEDPAELIHAHIAKAPIPPHKIQPAIPESLSTLVLKLMAKDPKDRYQSAMGLQQDLEYCLRTWKSRHKLDVFSLAQGDFSEDLSIAQHLYGRTEETRKLMHAYRMAKEKAGICLVAGYSGIGKTSLVQELFHPITLDGGRFITGKFEKWNTSPYAPIISAFRELLKQICMLDEKGVRAWCQKLRDLLGDHLAVLTEALPELPKIVGAVAPLALTASEAGPRFTYALAQLIKAFADSEEPLVLFLDDLQWADHASLTLVERLVTTEGMGTFFIIGAYRDNEIDGTHPLHFFMERLKKNERWPTLKLMPLNGDHVAAFLADTFHQKPGRVAELARVAHLKTGGNPFFIIAFLRSLVQKELIYIDRERHCWDWDIAAIGRLDMTDNVLDILGDKLDQLDQGTRNLLNIAACIGNRFDLSSLQAVSKLPANQVGRHLLAAASEHFILPLDEAARWVGSMETGIQIDVRYKFAHDRVQQAIYESMAERDRMAFHKTLGRIWQSDGGDRGCFEITDQLNQARDLMQSTEDRLALVALNHSTGKKAMTSGAFEAAAGYFATGLAILDKCSPGEEQSPENATKEKGTRQQRIHRLRIELLQESIQPALLLGKHDLSNAHANRILRLSKNQLDRIAAVRGLIEEHKTNGRHQQCLQLACDQLAELGIDIPLEPSKEDVRQAVLAVGSDMAGKTAKTILRLPVMEDPINLLVGSILDSMFFSSVAMPLLLPIIASNQVLFSLKNGNSPDSITGYSRYSSYICPQVGQQEIGEILYEVSHKLIHRFNAQKYIPVVTANDALYIRPFKEAFQKVSSLLNHNYEIGLQYGDIAFGTISLFIQNLLDLMAGKPLPQLEQEIATCNATFSKYQVENLSRWHRVWWQTSLNLQGKASDPSMLVGDAFDERVVTGKNTDESKDFTLMIQLNLNRAMLHYLFGDPQTAADRVPPFSELLPDFPDFNAEYWLLGSTAFLYKLFHSLACLRLCPTGHPTQVAHIPSVMKYQKERARWAEQAPMNFLSSWHLVEAEINRVGEDRIQARHHYDQAIDLARHYGNPFQEALACELAGKFFLDQEQSRIAGYYLQDAHNAYHRWGALAKTRDLEQRYPQLMAGRHASVLLKHEDEDHRTTGEQSPGLVDLRSILKANQTISGEIVLEKLMGSMMRTLLENGGAQSGALVLKRGDQWMVEAWGSVNGEERIDLPAENVKTSDRLPAAVANFVLTTDETLFINDGDRDFRFEQDAYLVRHRPLSLLCTPIRYQGETIALLYLEHRTAKEVFTEGRIDVLHLLTAQTAISIQNARLYAELEQKVDARTEELSAALKREETQNMTLKRTQSQLVHAEKMASLAPLTAGIAHEINNPNTFILAGVRNLERQLEQLQQVLLEMAGDGPEVADFIKDGFNKANRFTSRILEGGERIESIVKDLRIFTRHDQAEHQRVRLGGDLRATVNLIQPNYAEAVTIVCQVCDDPELRCFPAQLDQVFANLVLNGCQAIAEKVGVAGEPGQLAISMEVEEDSLMIRFEDNGSGIPRTVRDKIFEPFFTTREIGQGRGLGLSIALGIVERHGGRMLVDSIEGEGSTFTICLPLAGIGEQAA